MYILNQAAAQSMITGWITSGAASMGQLTSFLRVTDSLLNADMATMNHPIRDEIGHALHTSDEREIVSVAQRVLGDEGVFERAVPAAVAQQVESQGYGSLDALLSGDPVPYLASDREIGAVLKEAFSEEGKLEPRRVDKSSLLEAANRQRRVWNAVQAKDRIGMSEGALTSGGQFDSLMMLLYQAGLRYRRIHNPDAQAVDPLLVGLLTKPEDESDMYALIHSAGVQEMGLWLHQYRAPFRTTAYPYHVGPDLRGRFELQFFTPKGSLIDHLISPATIENLLDGAYTVYSTKSFSNSGKTVTERTKEVAAQTDGDVSYAFVAGFAGAKAAFNKELPAGGLDIGLGTNDLEKGLALASLLTGREIDQASVMEVGGAKVYSFSNTSLERPLTVHVYDDPDLCRAQELYAIYKNVYSGILGDQLFQWIFERLGQECNHADPRCIEAIALEAEEHYEGLISHAQGELRSILVTAERIPPEKAVILEHSAGDALGSWRLRPGGSQRLVHLIATLFFEPRDATDPRARKPMIQAARERWLREIGEVFATRNPQAGASLAAGMKARRYNLLNDPKALMDPNTTFEGLNTALGLDRRLDRVEMNELPPPVRNYIEQARHIRQPTLFPDQVWDSLDVLTSFLAKRARGAPIGQMEMEAFLLRPPREEELTDRMRWQSGLKVDDFAQAVAALQFYLQQAIGLMVRESMRYPHLAETMVQNVRAMIRNVGLLQEKAREREQRLEPIAIQQLLLALGAMISEGHRIYVTESFEGLMRDLLTRVGLMYAFIEDYGKPEQERRIRSPFPERLERLVPHDLYAALRADVWDERTEPGGPPAVDDDQKPGST